jgi:hypothetical protein
MSNTYGFCDQMHIVTCFGCYMSNTYITKPILYFIFFNGFPSNENDVVFHSCLVFVCVHGTGTRVSPLICKGVQRMDFTHRLQSTIGRLYSVLFIFVRGSFARWNYNFFCDGVIVQLYEIMNSSDFLVLHDIG